MLALSEVTDLRFGLAIGVSGLGAAILGSAIGAVASSTIEINRRQAVTIGLVAALGAFAAAAVMDPPLTTSDAAERLWYTAALHIGVGMVAADWRRTCPVASSPNWKCRTHAEA
jgi:peptidoglycan/LPS O-acetylase OafA/YrhL